MKIKKSDVKKLNEALKTWVRLTESFNSGTYGVEKSLHDILKANGVEVSKIPIIVNLIVDKIIKPAVQNGYLY